jgi:type III pantothenate kinase
MNNFKSEDWLCLIIGNSRYHWAWFQDTVLNLNWDSQHLTQPIVNNQLPQLILPTQVIKINNSQLPLYLASVVPQQTSLWQTYPHLRQITLADILLPGIYPTMGIDRALAIWGANNLYGCPCLVVDAGTALTLTGINERKKFVGGAILPGLKLQIQSLASGTAALPESLLPQSLPIRWSSNTMEAIASGVIYTLVAGIYDFINDWCKQFPHSPIIFTGGDSLFLVKCLAEKFPLITSQIKIDPNLIFWGVRLVYLQNLESG